MNRVIIGMGSNVDPVINIEKAKEIMGYRYVILSGSRFRLTKPIGGAQQDDFVNGTVLLETALSMKKLKIELNIIESIIGRTKEHDPNAPRVIDLDIVVWNGKIIDQDFYQRDYLKESVMELIPDLKY